MKQKTSERDDHLVHWQKKEKEAYEKVLEIYVPT